MLETDRLWLFRFIVIIQILTTTSSLPRRTARCNRVMRLFLRAFMSAPWLSNTWVTMDNERSMSPIRIFRREIWPSGTRFPVVWTCEGEKFRTSCPVLPTLESCSGDLKYSWMASIWTELQFETKTRQYTCVEREVCIEPTGTPSVHSLQSCPIANEYIDAGHAIVNERPPPPLDGTSLALCVHFFLD